MKQVLVGAAVVVLCLACSASAMVTEQVSVNSSGAARSGAAGNMSADGRYVVFASDSSEVVYGDTNGVTDVFVHDRQTGITERVSVSSGDPGGQANGPSSEMSPLDNEVWEPPCISGDGRFVVFSSSATNLVTDDTNGVRDVFVRDRVNHTTVRVSLSSSGQQTNGLSCYPSVSGDGSRVAFVSLATNLVSGDTNGAPDVFIRDLPSGNTYRVDLSSAGVQASGQETRLGHSIPDSDIAARISGDGLHVAFVSSATNLVPGDTNHTYDMFVRDLNPSNLGSGLTERTSVSTSGQQCNDFCWGSLNVISHDGSVVVFSSFAGNLDEITPDTNGQNDVFVRDRNAHTTRRVSLNWQGGQANSHSGDPSCSADGSKITFHNWADELLPGGDGLLNLYMVNRDGTGLERIGVDSTGASQDGWDALGFVSPDGRFVSLINIPSSVQSLSDARAMVVDRSAVTISDAKSKPDGTSVDVSAGFATARFDGAFYVAQDGIAAHERASGLRISSPELVQVGKRYVVTGQMRTTADGERYLDATSVSPHTSGWTVSSKTTGMNNKTIGGGDWNYSEGDTSGQMGIAGASGLNNIGLPLAGWGRVTGVSPDRTYFYIDDGSSLGDGTSTSGSANIGVRVLLNAIDLSVGDYVSVDGISSCFRNTSGEVQRLIRGTQFAPHFPAAPAVVFSGVPSSSYPNDIQVVFGPVLGAAGYRLYRSTDGTNYSLVGDTYTPIPGGGGMFHRTEYTNAYFRVKAVDSGGNEGAASETMYARVQVPREDIAVTQPSSNETGVSRTPSISWQAVVGNAKWIGMEIHEGSATVWGAMMMWPGTALNYGQVDNCLTYIAANAPLKPLTQYRVFVYAIDSDHWEFANTIDWYFTTGLQ